MPHSSPTRRSSDLISVSHEVAPLIKLIGRGDTTLLDAYLSPVLRRYVDRIAAGLPPAIRLQFMQSNGGLADAQAFRGKDAILSGPAGRSEEHTSELQSLMRSSYAVFCLKKN